jgi:hypothetical protein
MSMTVIPMREAASIETPMYSMNAPHLAETSWHEQLSGSVGQTVLIFHLHLVDSKYRE